MVLKERGHFDTLHEQKAGKFILVNPANSVYPEGIGKSSEKPWLVEQMQSGKSREQIDAEISGKSIVELHGMIETFGRKTNKITNTLNRNRLGMLETSVEYTKDNGFNARMNEIQQHVDTIFKKMNVGLTGKPTISWRADHAASVCRMGNQEADSVVDPNLRIHGVDNLYVCSNATMPSIGAINPTLTLTALSLRLGDHLSRSALGE